MTPTEPVPPEPAPEPDDEPGENREAHLLPDLARLRRLSRDERADLIERVRDWSGPIVEAWRERVRSL